VDEQRGFEVAMGMHGYEGSVASLEDKKEERKRLVELVREVIKGKSKPTVMFVDYLGRIRHLRVYSDGPFGYYVRTGKRGTCREGLARAEVVCRDPLVVQFFGERERQVKDGAGDATG